MWIFSKINVTQIKFVADDAVLSQLYLRKGGGTGIESIPPVQDKDPLLINTYSVIFSIKQLRHCFLKYWVY